MDLWTFFCGAWFGIGMLLILLESLVKRRERKNFWIPKDEEALLKWLEEHIDESVEGLNNIAKKIIKEAS